MAKICDCNETHHAVWVEEGRWHFYCKNCKTRLWKPLQVRDHGGGDDIKFSKYLRIDKSEHNSD